MKQRASECAPRYVIITPAHNEEAFIEKTIRSMLAQTAPPLKWIIVNDASQDRTGEIVSRYLAKDCFIHAIKVERSQGRNFGNKVTAFNHGLAQVAPLDYDYIGNLDADISFEANYFANILREFARDPRLGIAGGMVHTSINGEYVSQNAAADSVAGAVQLFRRQCFEQIGGYRTMLQGGIDSAAEITARMKGWRVCTIADQRVLEHRQTGSATARPLAARVKEGRLLRLLGYGLLFFLVRCAYRSMEKPWVLGSSAVLTGYLESAIKREALALPPETVQFLRKEQRTKLKRLLRLA